MAVDVDHAGRDIFALPVDHRRAGGIEILADRDDLAVAEQHLPAIDPPALAIEHGDVGQQRRRAGIGTIGRGEGIVAIALALAGAARRRGGIGCGALRPGAAGIAGRETRQRTKDD